MKIINKIIYYLIYFTILNFFFSGKYLQFIKLNKNQKYTEAASLYIELLKSNICPK